MAAQVEGKGFAIGAFSLSLQNGNIFDFLTQKKHGGCGV